jgi:hypothetical protein
MTKELEFDFQKEKEIGFFSTVSKPALGSI